MSVRAGGGYEEGGDRRGRIQCVGVRAEESGGAQEWQAWHLPATLVSDLGGEASSGASTRLSPIGRLPRVPHAAFVTTRLEERPEADPRVEALATFAERHCVAHSILGIRACRQAGWKGGSVAAVSPLRAVMRSWIPCPMHVALPPALVPLLPA